MNRNIEIVKWQIEKLVCDKDLLMCNISLMKWDIRMRN